MSRPTLTSRERVLLALAHRETDRIPIAMICAGLNPPAAAALDSYLGRTRGLTAAAYLEPLLDVAAVGPAYVGPTRPPGCDEWGVERVPVSYGPASYYEIAHHPLAEAESLDDLARYPWPRPDWFDHSTLPEQIRAVQSVRERCLMAANGNIFETAWYLRGLARMLEDLVTDPDWAWALLCRVTDFYVAHFRRLLEAAGGGVDLVFTADDIAGQQGLLLSLPLWERLLKPHHARLNAVLHEFGVKVVYHSDGAVADAVPGLIEMGIDVLQALQFSAAGMDPGRLKEQYGDRLCFAGGVSVQTTLPFGTPEQVRAEVEHLITVLGRRGGYVLGPSHAVQAGTPPENVVAAFDTAASFYPYG